MIIENSLSTSHGQALSQHPAATYLASLSQSGRRTMLQALNLSADLLHGGATAASLPWHECGYQHITALRTRLIESGRKPATVNKTLCAVRRVLKEAWRLGLMSAEQYHRAADVPGVKGTSLPTGRMLEPHELSALKEACTSTRDRAMLAVLARGGLRRHELVGLELGDVREDGQLVVRGKGSKERLVPLGNGALIALKEWINDRGQEPGPLFVAIRKDGRMALGKRMTAQAVYYRLQELGTRAGVAAFTPHDLRRTCGSDLLDAGADVFVMAGILGHSSVEVTRRSYDRRGERAATAAANLLSF